MKGVNGSRHLWLALALGVVGLAGRAAPAEAQVIQRSNLDFRSAKRFALELRFGPYSPDIDSEFKNGQKPHETYFGNSRRLLTQLELDYQFFTRFGSAAVGLSGGYFTESAKSFFDPSAGQPAGTRSGDSTRLTLFPTALLGIYRADQLWHMFRIPLVPYGKLGLNYTFWSIYDGNDEIAKASAGGMSGKGRGGTWGWQASVGLSLVLDFIDPGSARELDSETGVNHTHIFAEWTKYAVSGLGGSDSLNVGDSTWSAGLLFEF
jgi:hypothetical protein